MTAPRLDSSQSLAEMLLRLPEVERDAFMATLTDQEIRLIEADLEHLSVDKTIQILPHQRIPEGSRGHILTGGRGAGKTEGLTSNAVAHMRGPACDARVPGGHRVLAVSPTAADAISALHYGPSGITAKWPGTRLSQGSDGAHLVTPNGIRIRLIGAFGPEDVERARAAGGTCLVLCDEMATWKREEIWDNIKFGLRLGPHPMWIGATTPKNRKLYKKLMKDPKVTHTHATIHDNPYLPEDVKADLLADYAGTRVGRQELDGELLEDVEGALWNSEMVEQCQIDADHPVVSELRRTVVGVDPSGSEDGDETGILAGGLDALDRAIILQDASCNGTADKRFTAVCMTAHKHGAGMIVYEAQFSGDNYAFGIEQKWKELVREGTISGPCPRVNRTSARGSKWDRAMVLSGLYEQKRVKHLPGLSGLEDQQTTFEIDSSWSPDRIDAEGYLVRELLAGRGGAVEMDSGLTSEGQTMLAEASAAAADGRIELLGDLADFGGSDSLGLGLHPALDRTFSALDRAFAGAVGIDVDGESDVDGADLGPFD